MTETDRLITVRQMLHEAIDLYAYSGERLLDTTDVGDLVETWFEDRYEYEGLYNDVGADACGCSLVDHCPCGGYDLTDCVAAHRKRNADGNMAFYPGPRPDKEA